MTFTSPADAYHDTETDPLRPQEPTRDNCITNVVPVMPRLLEESLPIIIPQTSRAFRGVYYSPFLRAYPEVLEAHGISKPDFIRLIDDLNESFISSPFFYGIMIAGTAVSFVPELAAQVVGGVVATAASFAGTANSRLRSKLFVKAANQDVFGPIGLHIRILNTKDMLEAIKVDEEKFKLPPLPEYNKPESWQESEDPRHRWMKALEGIVSPLDYDVPDYSKQESWLKKAGAWTAKVQDKRQAKSLMKRREKAQDKIAAAYDEHALNEERIQIRIDALRKELDTLTAQTSDVDTDYDDPKVELRRQADIAECENAIRREESQLVYERANRDEIGEVAAAKVDKKEHKVVQKIRWVVIIPGTEDEGDDEDADNELEEVRTL